MRRKSKCTRLKGEYKEIIYLEADGTKSSWCGTVKALKLGTPEARIISKIPFKIE